jgi:head-tail adaptor
MLLFNKMVSLITVTKGKDADGYPTGTETKLEHIPAAYKSVYGNDFYASNAQGIKADVVVVIAAVNYSGETKLVDEENNHAFKVIRTFLDGLNLEITCTDLGVEA